VSPGFTRRKLATEICVLAERTAASAESAVLPSSTGRRPVFVWEVSSPLRHPETAPHRGEFSYRCATFVSLSFDVGTWSTARYLGAGSKLCDDTAPRCCKATRPPWVYWRVSFARSFLSRQLGATVESPRSRTKIPAQLASPLYCCTLAESRTAGRGKADFSLGTESSTDGCKSGEGGGGVGKVLTFDRELEIRVGSAGGAQAATDMLKVSVAHTNSISYVSPFTLFCFALHGGLIVLSVDVCPRSAPISCGLVQVKVDVIRLGSLARPVYLLIVRYCPHPST